MFLQKCATQDWGWWQLYYRSHLHVARGSYSINPVVQRHKLFSRGSRNLLFLWEGWLETRFVIVLFYNAQSEFYDEGRGSSSPSRSYISTIVAIFCSVGPVSLRSQSYCWFSVMVLQRRILHPRGLSLSMQSRVYALRKSSKPPPAWRKIARQVRNRQGKMPYWKVCRDVYNKLKNPTTVDSDGYSRCDRKTVLTKS